MSSQDVAAAIETLEADQHRLQNSISHLERSNQELAAVAAEEPDPEYRQAISDNIVTIAKYRARVATLEQEVEQLRQGMGSHIAVPAPGQQQQQNAGSSGVWI